MRKNGFFCGFDSRSKHQLTYAERQTRPLFCNAHENRNKLMRKMRKKNTTVCSGAISKYGKTEKNGNNQQLKCM